MSTTILGDALWGTNLDLGPAPGPESDEGGEGGEGGEDENESESGGASGSGDQPEDESGEGDESEESGEGSSEQASDGDDSGEASGDASDKSGEDGEDGEDGEGQKPGHQDAPDGPQGEEGKQSSDGITDSNEGSNSAGGGAGEGTDEDQLLAEQLLAALLTGGETGLKDSNQALGETAADEAGEDSEDALQEGEQAWRPFSTDNDKIYIPSQNAKELETAQKYKKSVKAEVAALKAKLRAKFLQARAPKVLHGVRKGDSLSLRSGNLVNTSVEIRSGRRPTRPDQRTVQQEACTIATAIVIDQSGSMDRALIKGATQAAIAISTALDSVGSPVMVCSPRDGGRGHSYRSESPDHNHDQNHSWYSYHRHDNITLDLFKDWGERMNSRTLSRFGGITSTGSTPLSDGIQFALQELDGRRERHRVVFVITDGHPNNSNVVRWQIRKAAEAGVTVVGVGIGYGASYVSNLFPVHVYRAGIDGVAGDVLECLSGMVFPKRTKKLNLSSQRIA